MSRKTFKRFSEFIRGELGIKMPDVKRTMLQARLQKRLRKLGMNTFDDYYDYVFSPQGMAGELANMIDVVTTNKTDFFREPKHFDYLSQVVLPRFVKKHRIGAVSRSREPGPGLQRVFKLWSVGCSSGEEPYSLAMALSDFGTSHPGFTYTILATDISVEMLKKAKLGIYDHERVEPVPMRFRKKYLLKSRDKDKRLVRVVPELRATVHFQRINLAKGEFAIQGAMDVIFFRNVLIYFGRATQELVLNRLCQYLKPDGHMFLGHSETLSGLNVPLASLTTAVYMRSK
ncbi:MAG: chemotaxis protein CheR [Desulfobacteraceae bacterium 4572_88]|nr:MAG: chemotaxis protein CheR [Desulfobacteraceae bacterium 4572_88]